MRIVIDVTSAASSPMSTGIQRVVRGTRSALEQIGHEMLPIIWDDETGSYRALTPVESVNLNTPWQSWHSRLPTMLRGPVTRFTERRLEGWKQQASAPLGEWLDGAGCFLVPEIFRDGRIGVFEQARKSKATPWIAYFYDATPLKLAEITDPDRRSAIDGYHRALSRFDAVIAASQETRTDIEDLWRQLGVPSSKTRVLPWPISFEEPRPVAAPNFEARSLLYVATLEGRKNHLTLLEAAEHLWKSGERFTLRLIGRATKHWGPQVRNEIARLRKARRDLVWEGTTTDQRLEAAYNECSATVFPSLMEGYGIPILESLWFGRPCLCGNNGAIGEVSSGGGCLHADMSDATALSRAMRQLLNDATLYQRLHSEAQARTFPHWDAFASRLLIDEASTGAIGSEG